MASSGLRIPLFSLVLFSALVLSASLTGADIKKETFTMKLGKFQVTVFQDAAFEMNVKLFRSGDKDVIKKLMPEGKLPASDNVFLVKTGKHNILIDTGKGDKLEAQLAAAGVKPDDIDIILITHAHGDHVSGLVKNGKAFFSSAKLMFSRDELAWIRDPGNSALSKDVKAYLKQVLDLYGSRVEAFVSGAKITEGITAMDISGHTPGQSGFLVESGGLRLFIAGDLLHVAGVQFAYPDYSLVYDVDIVKAAETRRRILAWAADEKILVAGTHIPLPGIGTVKRGKDGFIFTPVR